MRTPYPTVLSIAVKLRLIFVKFCKAVARKRNGAVLSEEDRFSREVKKA
jgi:hypothetical protein